MNCFITNTWRISLVWHLILQIRHFLICPLDESWPTDSLLPDVALPPLGWPWWQPPSQAREGNGRWDVPTAGHSLAMIPKCNHSSWPKRGSPVIPFLSSLQKHSGLPSQPSSCSDMNLHKCRTLVLLHFYLFVRQQKDIYDISKQQSSCASLKFPTWQCAGSWRRLQTKPKLWQLVWSLHLC